MDRDAAIIFGADIREDIDDEVQVTIIATGFDVKPTDKPLKQNVFAGKETENSALSPAKELYGSQNGGACQGAAASGLCGAA